MGFEFRRPWNNEAVCVGLNGSSGACPAEFKFDNLTTSLPGSPNFSTLGSPTASFLLGIADESMRTTLMPTRGIREAYGAGYFQDDFKITPKLTANLGLRWDIYSPLTEVHDMLTFVNLTEPNPDAGGRWGAETQLGTCPVCIGTNHPSPIHWHNFAPRIGFAYRLNSKTVARVGGGITYFLGGSNDTGNTRTKTAYNNCLNYTGISISENGGVTPGYGSWDNTYPTPPPVGVTPGCANNQAVNLYESDTSKAPYVENWTGGVQRELPGNMLLGVSYVGDHFLRLLGNLENPDQVNPSYLSLGSTLLQPIGSPAAIAAGINAPWPGFTGSVAEALRPYPQYESVENNYQQTASARYQALQVVLEKRFSQGLSMLVSYTLSRSLGNNDSGFAPFTSYPINTFDRKAEWSISSADMPNVLSIGGVYELPIGPAHRFVNKSGPLSKLVGGWQFGWHLLYESGTPQQIGATNVLPLYGGPNRANVVPGVPCQINMNLGSSFNPSVDPVLNIAAFSQPPDYTFGNAPRESGNCRTFPTYDEDINLIKKTKISETVGLEFRVEFFNIFNRVVFGAPNTSYAPNSTSFGIIGSQANIPREGQFALRLTF
jgi:hypothetical protein